MQPSYSPVAYFNQQFVPFEQATISIATHALQYGSGVFGGIRGYLDTDGQTINLFRLADHVRRFRQSAALMGIAVQSSEAEVIDIILELVKKNKPNSDIYIRPFAYKAGLDLPPGMHGVANGLAIYMTSLGRLYGKEDEGLAAKVSSWRRIEDTAIPARAKVAGAYINSSLAKDEAVALGFDDAILLNDNGSVAEASSCNLFIVRNGQLITPPVSDNILEGITRRSVIELAAELEIPLVERSVDRTELYIADEVIFCGTAVEVSWVSRVDSHVIGHGQPGDVFAILKERFVAIVQGRLVDHAEWLTKVTFD